MYDTLRLNSLSAFLHSLATVFVSLRSLLVISYCRLREVTSITSQEGPKSWPFGHFDVRLWNKSTCNYYRIVAGACCRWRSPPPPSLSWRWNRPRLGLVGRNALMLCAQGQGQGGAERGCRSQRRSPRPSAMFPAIYSPIVTPTACVFMPARCTSRPAPRHPVPPRAAPRRPACARYSHSQPLRLPCG